MVRVLEDLKARAMRPATIKDRRERFLMLARLIDTSLRLDEIAPRDVQEYVNRRMAGVKKDKLKACSVATAIADVRALNTVFTLAIREGLARENPITRARLPKPERHPEIDWFTPEELTKLLKRIRDWPRTARLNPERDASMIELLALTGWRLTEATNLQMSDIAIPQRLAVLRTGKTGRRTSILNDDALAIVNRWKKERPDGPLFPAKRHTLESALRRWQDRLDEPRLHAHALRHTFGTALAAAGVPAHALAREMGHASLSTSLIYVHLSGEKGEAVAGLSFRKPARKAGTGKKGSKRRP